MKPKNVRIVSVYYPSLSIPSLILHWPVEVKMFLVKKCLQNSRKQAKVLLNSVKKIPPDL